ncbi:unnamed protein product [Linum tenue]|uniref:Uncharacterized protein n=1 Tax=Linum tenue TaxID=586396 RepID=A0AAV0JGS5_9ROSI|nr:unnamed protein product [Linum tenue]
MAALSFHARSNSFPAESHPLVSEIDEQVCRLRQSQAASTSSSISHKLNGLQDLYGIVDKLLQLSTTQQALANDQKCFNEVLEGSLRLLDLCNTAKDALSQMKESVAELQSAIRRRQGGLEGETRRYLKSRCMVKKAIQKALKGMDSKKSVSSNNIETVAMLKEAESAVVEVLECLLLFISQTSSKSSSWSLVSKLMTNQKPVCQENEFADKVAAASSNENEFAEVDASLKTNKSGEEVQVHLKNLQPCIQDLEEGVEWLLRRVIKTRASILNIHNL